MAASGSPSKGFDFASDDILCSYEDYTNNNQQQHDTPNGSDSAPTLSTNSKEFHKNRMARTSVFPTSSYSPPDESGSQEVIILAVERSMKKYTDNLMRFLEGLSSRLSQLELYCYNLDKSIGEMRSDLTRDHEESDAKLKFLEKHVQEVHRSVQILRDKQELADTQKELAKLQLAQKESSSSHNSQQNEDRSSTPDNKKNDNAADSHGQQLALVLPSQVAAPPAAPLPQRVAQPMSQPQGYYMPPPGPTQLNQSQYPQSQVPPGQPQLQQQPPQIQSMPPYQQQWAQQMQPQPSMQPGSRPSSPQVYPQYPEPLPNSMPMQMPYSATPPGASQPLSYTYGAPARTAQPQPPSQQPPHHVKPAFGGQPGDGYPPQSQPPPQHPPQHLKPTFGGQPGDGYAAQAQPPPQQPPQHMKPTFGGQPGDGYGASGQPQGNAYMMYDNQSGHYTQGSYPPNAQQTGGGGGTGMMSRPAQQLMRNHPYNELIDKLVSMGYRGDHVMSVIQRLDETGQTVDFNAVLDRLNGHPPGGSQRGWSG
uniref:glutenin, high molecular weight subunit DX5 n=1 Tax=Erigeron canadensis TaxID=72917 RepID=UPI001CB9B031|nr:glutenin, high molecular weight subunit DX5 [Erigeron canadensis]